MTEDQHGHAIETLALKLVKTLNGSNPDIAVAALCTTVGIIIVDACATREDALGALTALQTDTRLFVESAFLPRGRPS